VMGTVLIVTAVTATSMAPIALWFVGLFVVVLLWLVSRRW
jgi:MYXO-CTERM domain-containing protein